MTKYFDLNNEVIDNDLKHKGRVNLNTTQQYHMDYGTCTLTCIHKKVKWFNIEITAIICGELCYTLPIEVLDLPIDNPRENLFNCSHLIYESYKQFQNNCNELSLQNLYEIQQQLHLTLLDMLDKIPPEF